MKVGFPAKASSRSTMGLLSVLAAAGTFSAADVAHAADPEPVELRQVSRTLSTPNFTPSPAVGLQWDRETAWTMLALTDPWELRQETTLLSGGPLAGLTRTDVREGVWQSTPYAATTVASAFAALATRGIPVFAEMRDYRTIRTHRLGCYFKGRGGGLVWRLEF